MRVLMVSICLLIASPAWAMEIPEADTASAKLYAQRCSVCHSLPHPGRLDWPHWRSMLHVMKQRMDDRGMEMPAEEWKQIAGYLKRHAR